MKSEPPVRKSAYVLLIFLMLFFAGGLWLFFIGSDDYFIRSLGLIVIMLSGFFLKKYKKMNNKNSVKQNEKIMDKSVNYSDRGRSIMLTVGMILLAFLGVSTFLLYKDANNGSKEAWPLYLFASIGLICTFYWTYLVLKLKL